MLIPLSFFAIFQFLNHSCTFSVRIYIYIYIYNDMVSMRLLKGTVNIDYHLFFQQCCEFNIYFIKSRNRWKRPMFQYLPVTFLRQLYLFIYIYLVTLYVKLRHSWSHIQLRKEEGWRQEGHPVIKPIAKSFEAEKMKPIPDRSSQQRPPSLLRTGRAAVEIMRLLVNQGDGDGEVGIRPEAGGVKESERWWM